MAKSGCPPSYPAADFVVFLSHRTKWKPRAGPRRTRSRHRPLRATPRAAPAPRAPHPCAPCAPRRLRLRTNTPPAAVRGRCRSGRSLPARLRLRPTRWLVAPRGHQPPCAIEPSPSDGGRGQKVLPHDPSVRGPKRLQHRRLAHIRRCRRARSLPPENNLVGGRLLLLGLPPGLLRAARRIEVYGIGSSGPIAQDLAYRLLQLGRDAKVVSDSHIQAVSAAMTDSSTAVVTISHSGSTRETVLATRLAREAGARTIGITKLGKSPLARYCDIVLHTIANETRYRPEAMSSRVAQLALIDTLVSCCALADAKRSVAKLELSARIIAGKRF